MTACPSSNSSWPYSAASDRRPAVRRGPRPTTRSNPAGLTRREAEVLALVAACLRNAEIAERLYLSPRTVMTHINNLIRKLGVNSRTAAIAIAYQRNPVEPGPER